MKKHVLICTALAAGGFALGWCIRAVQLESPVVPAQAEQPVAPVVHQADNAETALALSRAKSEVAALKAEKARLESALQAKEVAAAEVTTAAALQAPQEPPRPRSRREIIEEMKEKEPERYQAMMTARAEFMQARREAQAEQQDFLSSIDLSLLSEQEQLVHAQFMEAIQRQAALMERQAKRFDSGEEASEEDRQEMWETMRTVNQLREVERQALLGAVATSMGLSESDSADFTQLITEIYDSTSGGRMRPPRGEGPNGGPRPMPPMH